MSTHAKPRAYELHRLLAAIRPHARLLTVVGLVGLFGGAAVARWLVPDVPVARALVHIGREPHVVLARDNQEALLSAAIARAGMADDTALHARVHVGFAGDRLVVEARGVESAAARTLVRELATGYVAAANARMQALAGEQRAVELVAARDRQARARLLLERAQPVAQAEREAALRAQIAELDAALQRATLQRSPRVSHGRELAEAQRALSRLLAQGTADARVNELHDKIARLQRAAANPTASLAALSARLEGKRAELATLLAEDANVQALRAAFEEASARVNQLAEAPAPTASAHAWLEGPVQVELLSRRPLRLAASLATPLLALTLLLGYLLARALLALRVGAATEVAHWLQVPVLTSSSWPLRPEGLEALVDALADPALESLGTTLILPLSEAERPLAYTLTAQLNIRAQRHYR
ncbi:MAG TPA: hypothetical protein VI299_10705, partial [Polyangiales bacterium]